MKHILSMVLAAAFMPAGLGIAGIKSKEEIAKSAKAKVKHISSETLQARMAKGEDFLLVDVRTEKEFLAGHIRGATWAPRGKVEFDLPKITRDPGRDIVVYCRTGGRASLAAIALQGIGYKNVVDLDGGFQSWVKAGHSVYNMHGEVKVVAYQKKETAVKKIPVIYDSDIGDDIDDTWALAMLLNSPELDVKLVVGDQGKPEYRARIFAKMLERVGRTDIPIGMGIGKGDGGRQQKWVADYDLKKYPGTIHKDGVKAIIDTIMQSPEPITVIAVGPLPNIAEALKREPRIAEKARFVGMHGSVRLGYGGNKKIAAEYNVRANAKACAKVLSAPWDVTITPLDTCGLVVLSGNRYQKVYRSKNPTAVAVMENYRVWTKNPKEFEMKSSTLFDTVAIYLAFSQAFTEMETLGIRVTDKGMTVIDPNAKKMKVATRWKDMNAFKDLLVERVTGQVK